MNDEQLVEGARRGSESAFAELVRRHQERLLRFLLTRCPSRADAEDALQDTFVNAYRYLDSYDPTWRFSTWLYRIAIRNAARVGQPATGEFRDTPDPDAGPLEACIADAERENLWLVAKRCLSPDAYMAMWLRHAEDMSMRDIARALDRTESWAKVTLHRSREALARNLTDGRDRDQRKVYG